MKAIDVLKYLLNKAESEVPEGHRIVELNVPVDIVREIIDTQPEPEWIPVGKRPPEEGQDVLITKESFKIKGYEQKVIKAKRSVDPRSGKIEWWSPEFGTLANKAVLAWMPLPEPYKEGEQG